MASTLPSAATFFILGWRAPNMLLLFKLQNRVRMIGPATLVPRSLTELGVEVFDSMQEGLRDADVVMMLRLQRERMTGASIPSFREYFHLYGLDRDTLSHAREDAIVMHPGPMNRGVEIDGTIADDINRSVIQEQVEMGVAVRMAVMDLLSRSPAAAESAGPVSGNTSATAPTAELSGTAPVP